MVSDGDPAVEPPLDASDDLPERLMAYDDFTAGDEPPGELATGLVSLGFFTAALRRSARFWYTTAAIGLLLGLGLYITGPSAYQASTTVLLVPPPGEQPGDSILTDVALAQSRAVAGQTVQKLGLRESASDFLGSYTVTDTTDRLLLITVGAPTSNEALARAKALAREFLQFRAQQAQAQKQVTLVALQQLITQAQQHIQTVSKQISQLSAQPASTAQQADLSHLRAELSQAKTHLPLLEQTVTSNQATARLTTTQMVRSSEVLDAAASLPHSRYKRAVLYAATGLLVGLALGMGIVIVRALVSDRLRRRDDVAYALGAPVKLSVGKVRLSRWRPGPRGLAVAQDANIGRIVVHLGGVVAGNFQGPAALAVVPVGNPQVAALSLASLAVSCAQQGGMQVVVADLCSGTPAARLLGVKDPGVHTVSVNDANLVVVVPEPDDIEPQGPLQHGSREAQAAQPLSAACASADLVLTLAALDPSVGGDHLATWATGVVVIVTAGRSSATKIHAVGEMIRIASTRLVSAVLVGADKTDESLGMTCPPGVGRDAEVVEWGGTRVGGFDDL